MKNTSIWLFFDMLSLLCLKGSNLHGSIKKGKTYPFITLTVDMDV